MSEKETETLSKSEEKIKSKTKVENKAKKADVVKPNDSVSVPTQEDIFRMKHLQSIMRHVENVQASAKLMSEKLMDRGEHDFARLLIANSMIHDNSKFYGIEWEFLLASQQDEEKLKLAIRQHVKTNPHHPEYWGNIKDMPRIYVAEMVADWNARSMEFGTDLREWIKGKACDKFDMTTNTKVYKQIKDFVDLLLDPAFK